MCAGGLKDEHEQDGWWNIDCCEERKECDWWNIDCCEERKEYDWWIIKKGGRVSCCLKKGTG